MVTDFKKKQKSQAIKYIGIAAGGVGILAVALALVVANINMYQKKQELNSQIASLKSKVEEIKQKNENLEVGIAQSNENTYIEKVAREELDLQKPGEKVVSFVLPPEEQQQENTEEKSGWWNWFKNLLHWGKN